MYFQEEDLTIPDCLIPACINYWEGFIITNRLKIINTFKNSNLKLLEMNKKINLSENHTRSLSSSLIVVDKSLSELEDLLLSENHTCCNMILRDIEERAIRENIRVIHEAKEHICRLKEKYGTSVEKLSLQRIINAKRTKIWVVLTESLSKRLKGYGEFPKQHVKEYNSDINKLIEITNRIT